MEHTQCEPRHDKRDTVVQHLQVQESHPYDIVTAVVDTPKMHNGIQTGRE